MDSDKNANGQVSRRLGRLGRRGADLSSSVRAAGARRRPSIIGAARRAQVDFHQAPVSCSDSPRLRLRPPPLRLSWRESDSDPNPAGRAGPDRLGRPGAAPSRAEQSGPVAARKARDSPRIDIRAERLSRLSALAIWRRFRSPAAAAALACEFVSVPRNAKLARKMR